MGLYGIDQKGNKNTISFSNHQVLNIVRRGNIVYKTHEKTGPLISCHVASLDVIMPILLVDPLYVVEYSRM